MKDFVTAMNEQRERTRSAIKARAEEICAEDSTLHMDIAMDMARDEIDPPDESERIDSRLPMTSARQHAYDHGDW